MQSFLTVILAIFVFGMLILTHELGHYLFARLFKVTVNEFSIGMGPRLISRVSQKTGIRYTLALIPFGGYVSMAGEQDGIDESLPRNPKAPVNDPNTFDKKPAWQRFIITIAGASVNIILGVIATVIVVSVINIGGTTVRGFLTEEQTGYEISSSASGLAVDDTIVAIGGQGVSTADELQYEILRRGHQPVDVTVIRGGKQMTLENVVFPTVTEDGQVFGMIDFSVNRLEKNVGTVLNHALHKSLLTIRQVWESIYDLITGRYTVAAVSGPVGISAAIGDAASYGFIVLLNLVAMISINLGVMNLLPIPALDGFRMLTTLFEMITRRRIPEKIEGIVNAVGLLILLGLSVLILVKDVFQLFG